MKDFLMEIAGSVFDISPLFESTRDYCRDYWSAGEPDFRITITRDDLQMEQKLLNLEADEEGLKRRKFSDMFLERSVIQRKVAAFLITRNVLMLHGSTVAVDGEAYLFTAACGTGKSTHTRLWREVFGERAVMVNDDKPFLKLDADRVLACGSPWTGKHGLGGNVSFPLKGICILKRGTVDRIRRISADEVRDMLNHQCFHLDQNDPAESMVEFLMKRISLWEMECTKEPSAALTAWCAMHE